MFTIKNVTKGPEDGHGEDSVRLYEGRNVMFEMNPPDRSVGVPSIPQVGFTMDDGTYCTIDTGVVYVMNSAGKTVDTYRLKNSDWFG